MNTPSLTTAPALSFRELLDYTAAEAAHWHRWLASQSSDVLDIPVGEGRTATVRGLVQHIIAVERRYTDRLRDEPVTSYEAISTESVDALFAAFTDARARLEQYLATATADDLARLGRSVVYDGRIHRHCRRRIIGGRKVRLRLACPMA
jgi:uncharacterized damage-inducible protein DinB